MVEVSSLDGAFKVFEAFGFQSFSIKSELTLKAGKRQMICAKIYLAIVWAVFMLSFALLFLLIWKKSPDPSDKENLNFFALVFFSACMLASVYARQSMAILRKRHMIKFFKNAEEISKTSYREFNHEINYRKLERPMKATMTLFLLQYIVVQVVIEFISKSTYDRVLNSLRVNIFESIVLTFVQFNFYAQIVLFNLEQLKRLLKENLCNAHAFIPQGNFVRAICKSEVRKIYAMRKIFCLIKEMADQFNIVMGFGVLFGLLLTVLSLVRHGYSLFMIMSGYELESVGSKSSRPQQFVLIVNPKHQLTFSLQSVSLF